MTDLRALVARMADELDHCHQLLTDNRLDTHELAVEARAALAQQAAPPADGEVRELVEWLRLQGACWANSGDDEYAKLYCRAADLLERLADGPAVQSREPASVTAEPSDEELDELYFDLDATDVQSWRAFARAVLARWGTPNSAETRSSLGDAPQPIPVSERLPEAGDCDAEGKCWWWYPPVPGQSYGCWLHEDDATDRARDEWPTHWLSAHALPVPHQEPSA